MKAMQIIFFLLALQLGAFLVTSFDPLNAAYPNQTIDRSTGAIVVTSTNYSDYSIIQNSSMNLTNSSLELAQIQPGLFGVADFARIFGQFYGVVTHALFGVYEITYEVFHDQTIAYAAQAPVYLVIGWGLVQFILGRSGTAME